MDVNSLLALLDSRKIGKLSVENVLSFLQLLSNAPGIDDSHKLFRSFDTNNSGELDPQAFSGMLNALEALLNRPTSAIIKEFLAKQFEKFFITVCEISKSPSANSPKPIKERYIDKKDVQTAMESSNMFPVSWSMIDKNNLFKKRFTYNTLSFDDFCTLFATCIEGKNLAEIQRSFDDAQQRRNAARSAFEGGGAQPNRTVQPPAAGGPGALANRLAAFTGQNNNVNPPPNNEPPVNLARPPPPPPRQPIPEVKIPPPVAAQSKAPNTLNVNNNNAAVNPPTPLRGNEQAKKKQEEEKKEEIKLAPALAFLSQPLKPDKKEEEKKKAEDEAKKAAETKIEEVKQAVDPKILKEAFNLMDVRKVGGLRVNDAVSFCQHLPQENMPVASTLHKIYKDCDADGSGEIEMEEFLDFMVGLENLTHMKAADMLAVAVREMYKRLFDMADEDKGGTIGRDELSLLMDCVSGMKASEVERVTRTFPEELDLDDFCEVIKRLTKGRSIAEVTAAFMEGKARRTASTEYAKKLEEEQKNKQAIEKGECQHCIEKRKKVASLLSQVEALQTQVEAEHAANAEKNQARRRRFTTVKKSENDSGFAPLDGGDILRGNLWETMYGNNNVFSAPFYSGCPALARPLMLRLASSRINGVADAISVAARETKSNADAAARWINENGQLYFDAIQELRVITDTFKVELKQFLVLYEKLLQVVVSSTEFNTSAAKTLCEEILAIRTRSATMRPDLERCSDSVVELRVEAANRILCAAPFTNIPADMAKCSGLMETATLQLRDIIAVALQLASAQLSDVEVWARRLLEKSHDRVTPESITEMKAFLVTCNAKLSSDQINDVIRSLDDTFREAQYTLRRTATYRRDKGVMTLTEEEIMAELEALKLTRGDQDEELAKAAGGPGGKAKDRLTDPSAFSTAKTRRMIDKSVDAIKEIDRALQVILKERPDVPLPPNFCRVDPTQNSFTFGTRVIELVPVDREAAVKVGGGYMFLEEFCKRNFEQEVRKLEWANKKFETTKVKIGGDDRSLRSSARTLSSAAGKR